MSTPLTRPFTQEIHHNQPSQTQERILRNKAAKWMALWVLANVIGFSLGELIGGKNGLFGLISHWSGIQAGWWWALGCVPYGFTFGVFERALMQPARVSRFQVTLLQSWAWPIASALGYAIGIGIGEKFTFGIAPSPMLLGPVFGLYVGLFLGIVQALALRDQYAHAWRWVPACVLVWVIGEWVAFMLGFQFHNTPIVGAVIGAVSGVLLLWLFPRLAYLK